MAEPTRTVTAAELARASDEAMPEVIRIRRYLHQHPELSGQEEQSAQMVANACRQHGLEVRESVGGHGVLATLRVSESAPWIALRADMDALPVQEIKERPYASRIGDVSHACGHDAHTAMLIGTAGTLSRLKPSLRCNVAFIFQPAEETCEGAAAMLRDHLFASFKPEQIYALHVYPYLPAGTIGFREGTMCAAADMFDVEIHGRGGHAARPHECTDVVLIATHVIQALHHIIGRRVNPLHPAVLTIGQIHGGYASNVIPDHIRFSGTFRSLHPEAHEEIRARMDHIIRQTAEAWGTTAYFTLRQATPILSNDHGLLHRAHGTFQSLLPDVDLVDLQEPSMGAEDFAEFLRDIPGCLFRLGTGAGPETRYPLHHPGFDIDEGAMYSGVRAMAALALAHG